MAISSWLILFFVMGSFVAFNPHRRVNHKSQKNTSTYKNKKQVGEFTRFLGGFHNPETHTVAISTSRQTVKTQKRRARATLNELLLPRYNKWITVNKCCIKNTTICIFSHSCISLDNNVAVQFSVTFVCRLVFFKYLDFHNTQYIFCFVFLNFHVLLCFNSYSRYSTLSVFRSLMPSHVSPL